MIEFYVDKLFLIILATFIKKKKLNASLNKTLVTANQPNYQLSVTVVR